MSKTIQTRIQHPVYTAAALAAKNPVLLKGEVVYESDTRKHKIGDGTTAWNALPYAGGGILRGRSQPRKLHRTPRIASLRMRKKQPGINSSANRRDRPCTTC